MALFSFLKFNKKGALEKKGPASKRQQKKNADTSRMKRKLPAGLTLITCISIMLIWASCCFSIIYRIHQRPDLVAGQTAPDTVYAQVDFQVIDLEATEVDRINAEASEPNHYSFNEKAFAERRKRLKELYRFLREASSGMITLGPSSPEIQGQPFRAMLYNRVANKETADRLLKVIGDNSDKAVAILEKLSRDKYDWVPVLSQTDLQRQKSSRYQLRFTDADGKPGTLGTSNLSVPSGMASVFLDQLSTDLRLASPAAADKTMALEILTEVMVPDLEYDAETTANNKKRARESVVTKKRLIQKNDLLLAEGKKVTEQDVRIVSRHAERLSDIQRNYYELGERAVWCLWITVAFVFLFFAVLPKFFRSNKNLLIGSIVVSLNILFLWGSDFLITGVFQQAPRYVIAALPLAFSAILLTLLFSLKEGIAFGVLVSMLHAVQTSESSALILALGLVTSVASAYAVRSVRTRLQIARVMLYLPAFSILIMSLYLFLKHQDLQIIPYLNCMWISVVSSGIIVILVNMFLPIFEWIFGLTTNISLLELSDLNHPLLKRLSLEAPGTYTHTMMVATLAEHAAEAIGANTLLTRVMSYFHDIGKLSNPIYFTENSFGQNHHEDLSPKMSARIIQNHVKEGLTMAAKYKLKGPLREAIATHHGDGLVYFFYHRAKTENSLEDSGGESEYRYPGPNPRSPEATIIALADSCEAASRSLEKPSPQKIDALVDEIFKGKLLGGQLDDSELSMSELNTALDSIKKTIRVMLHGRIAYPKNEELEKQLKTSGFAQKSREVESTRLMNVRKEKDTRADSDSDSDESKDESAEDTKTPVAIVPEENHDNPDKSPESSEIAESEPTGDDSSESPESDASHDQAEKRTDD